MQQPQRSAAVQRRKPQQTRRPARRRKQNVWSYGLLSDYKRKWDVPLFMVTIILLGCGLIRTHPSPGEPASPGSFYHRRDSL